MPVVQRSRSSLAWWLAATLIAAATTDGFPLTGRLDVQAAAAAEPTDVEWRSTDRSMLDLLAAGYDLVSVVAASPQTRLYFLRTSGNIIKCSEQAAPIAPPAVPPPPSPGMGTGTPPEPIERKSARSAGNSGGSTFNCSELVRAAPRRP